LEFEALENKVNRFDVRVSNYEETKKLLNQYYSKDEQSRIFTLDQEIEVKSFPIHLLNTFLGKNT